MCTYYKENKRVPCCTNECNGCVWYEETDTEENKDRVSIPWGTIEAINSFYHQRKQYRKSRFIKPIYRRFTKKFRLNRENIHTKTMYEILVFRN